MVESLNYANNPARVDSEEPTNWLLTILGLEKKQEVKNLDEYRGVVEQRALTGLTPFTHARIRENLSRVHLYGVGDTTVMATSPRPIIAVSVEPHGDSANRIVKFEACSDTYLNQETNKHTTSFDYSGSSCTCGVPMMTGLPCTHMMRAAEKLDIPYHSLVHRYYRQDTWTNQSITPEEALQTCMSRLKVSRLKQDRDDKALHLPPLRAPKGGRPSNSSRRKSIIKDFIRKQKKNLEGPQEFNAFQTVWREIVQQEEGIYRDLDDDDDDAYIEDPRAVVADFQEETQSAVHELEFANNVEFVIDEEEIHEEDMQPVVQALEVTNKVHLEERDSHGEDTSDSENNSDSENSSTS